MPHHTTNPNNPNTARPLDGNATAELNAWIDARPLTDEDVDTMWVEEQLSREAAKHPSLKQEIAALQKQTARIRKAADEIRAMSRAAS